MWHHATATDLEMIDRIAREVHPALTERPEIFAEKFRLFPEGCLVYASDETVTGYGLSHPWRRHDIPPLDSFLKRLPERADCMYVHDVALLPQARGRGAAGRYIKMVADIAARHGLRSLTLVSVYETSGLWSRLGFRADPDEALVPKLASYGSEAKYMVRDV